MSHTRTVSVRASTIRTSRLALVPLAESDADEMVDVLGDERMYEYTGGHPLTLDELRARYQRLAVGQSSDGSELWFNWIVRTPDDHRAIGVMQATVAPDGSWADVAWEIGVPWQGDGMASEAAVAVVAWLFDQDVETIRAFVHPDHIASARVAARAGLEATPEFVDGEVVWSMRRPPTSDPTS